MEDSGSLFGMLAVVIWLGVTILVVAGVWKVFSKAG